MGASPFQIEEQLLTALVASADVQALGFIVEPGEPRGVVISRGRHGRAVWNYHGRKLHFTPGGYAEPIMSATTVAEAVQITVAYLTGLSATRRP